MNSIIIIKPPTIKINSALLCPLLSVFIFYPNMLLFSRTVVLTSDISSFTFKLLSLVCIYDLYMVKAKIAITITPPNSNMYSAAPCPDFSLLIFF